MAEQTKELKDVANMKLKQMNEFEENKHKCLEIIHNIIYWRELGLKEQDVVPTKKEMSKLILAFHEREVRLQLVENLKAIGTPRQVVSLSGLQTLGELLKYLLTAIIHERDVNFKVIHAILNVSQLLYH